jgi:hypothetical protein
MITQDITRAEEAQARAKLDPRIAWAYFSTRTDESGARVHRFGCLWSRTIGGAQSWDFVDVATGAAHGLTGIG